MTKKYYPQLDFLRAFACLSVVAFHSNLIRYCNYYKSFTPWRGGYIGVDIFFVLSGYLITSILLHRYFSTGKIDIKRFYINRLLRLYPPIIFAVIVFLIPLSFVRRDEALSNIFFIMTYTTDVIMLFQKIIPSLKYPYIFNHCWSLAVEEQFYIIYPFVFLGIMAYYRKHANKNLIETFPFFTFLFVISLSGFTLLLKGYFYKFFLWRFFEIFFGGYVAVIFSEIYPNISPDTEYSKKIKKFIRGAFLNQYVFYSAILCLLYMLNLNLPFNTYNLHFFVLTIISSVLIVNLVYPDNINANALSIVSNKYLVYIGKISYGIYLYHYPIFFIRQLFFANIQLTFLHAIQFDLIFFTATIIVSVMSYEFVEKKFLSYKTRRWRME